MQGLQGRLDGHDQARREHQRRAAEHIERVRQEVAARRQEASRLKARREELRKREKEYGREKDRLDNEAKHIERARQEEEARKQEASKPKVDIDGGHADPLKTPTGELGMDHGKEKDKGSGGKHRGQHKNKRRLRSSLHYGATKEAKGHQDGITPCTPGRTPKPPRTSPTSTGRGRPEEGQGKNQGDRANGDMHQGTKGRDPQQDQQGQGLVGDDGHCGGRGHNVDDHGSHAGD